MINSIWDMPSEVEVEAVEREILANVRTYVGDRSNSTVVENSSMGYREGMRHEVRPAPAWRTPIAEFVEYLQAIRRSRGTVQLRSYHLRVLSNAFRNRSPFSLTESDMVHYLAMLQNHHGLNTARSYQMSFRVFYRWAHRRGMIQTDPMEYIDPIMYKKGVPRPADVVAVKSALQAASPRARLMIQLAVTAGLRRVEIARLHTRNLVRRPNGYALKVLGKGDKPRYVPVSMIVAGRIQELPEGWVFPSQKGIGRHILPGRVGEIMGEVLQPVGVTPHMLRHRFATTAFAHERDLRAVQELLGHASIATTEIYTEVPDDAIRTAADAAAALFA